MLKPLSDIWHSITRLWPFPRDDYWRGVTITISCPPDLPWMVDEPEIDPEMLLMPLAPAEKTDA